MFSLGMFGGVAVAGSNGADKKVPPGGDNRERGSNLPPEGGRLSRRSVHKDDLRHFSPQNKDRGGVLLGTARPGKLVCLRR